MIPDNTRARASSAFVGGSTAGNVDLAAEIGSRLPLVIGTILLLSMLVLLVAFRSLLIPLQAAVTNLLTALAAFGILTAAFQWGWGIGLVGIDTTASTGPDRKLRAADDVRRPVRPEHGLPGVPALVGRRTTARRAKTTATSVALGLKASARVIAAAALIMISVFSSFVLNGDPVVKQFGAPAPAPRARAPPSRFSGALTVAKSFTPASIATGDVSVLTVTLTNADSTAVTGAAFTDTYPGGLVNTSARRAPPRAARVW